MKSKSQRPIHPFPARMAPSIVLTRLPSARDRRLTVLDPMVGSGTTLVAARSKGHRALGCDTDPLAVLIARVWSSDIDAEACLKWARKAVAAARDSCGRIPDGLAYPAGADEETRRFAGYWFDVEARRQLRALADAISSVRTCLIRDFLWCVFSRLIVTKQGGVSLAMDVSHSRPHRVYAEAPVKALDKFEEVAAKVARLCQFDGSEDAPQPEVCECDARELPFDDESVDVVITSPPYLNAIDYLRGHRMSLVWMGHKMGELRSLRASNVGAEVGLWDDGGGNFVPRVLKHMGASAGVSGRLRSMLARYVCDMDRVVSETERVLVPNGRAVFVIGDSTIEGAYIRNSRAISWVGKRHGLKVVSSRRRQLPNSRRYLPPPTLRGAGQQLGKRMREEVVFTFCKAM